MTDNDLRQAAHIKARKLMPSQESRHMTPEQQALREAVAKMYKDKWGLSDYWLADAAIAVALEAAAQVAEGPPYKTSGTTREVSIRGTDKGNWSVPMPLSGFKGSDYGTGRYDAAAAIRALIPSNS